jgi:hypothetical protein
LDDGCRVSLVPFTVSEHDLREIYPAFVLQTRAVPTYRLHDTTGDDLGLLEHPAPNVEPGDVVVIPDGREALVTARIEAEPGLLAGLLEVVIAPSRLDADDALP